MLRGWEPGPDVGMCAYKLSTWKVEAGRSGVKVILLGYIVNSKPAQATGDLLSEEQMDKRITTTEVAKTSQWAKHLLHMHVN